MSGDLVAAGARVGGRRPDPADAARLRALIDAAVVTRRQRRISPARMDGDLQFGTAGLRARWEPGRPG
ncbi:MAG: hypothetical protein U0Q15_14585 [Kineosporiaceae bacterium]